MRIEAHGRQFEGRYLVQDGVVRLLSNIGVSRTPVGRLAPEPVARILLRQMVEERILNSKADRRVATLPQRR